MGTSVRLLGSPGAPLHRARCLIEDLEARLTRFDPHSELCALNADPRETVPASRTLRDAVRAAIAGAAATGGLADPTLLGAVVRAGYDRSLVGHPRADLHAALAAAPEPRPGAPSPRGRLAARPRRRRRRHGRAAARRPARPRRQRQGPGRRPRRRAARRRTARARPTSAATCACTARTRCWSPTRSPACSPRCSSSTTTPSPRRASTSASGGTPAGRPAHHLLDPSTGAPAWTGVLSATAKAPTAALAEALAKAAILAGPSAGRAILAPLRRPADHRRRRRSTARSAWPLSAVDQGLTPRGRGRHEGPDGVRLVAREPGVGHRRARPDRAVGGDRARDGGQGVPQAGPAEDPDRDPRARRAGGAGGDRRPRHHAARRQLAEPRVRSGSRCRS